MKNRVYFPFLLCMFIGFFGFAQDYSVSSIDIPAELKEDANAVIRDESWNITIAGVDRLEIKHRYVVTIFNKVGYERFTNNRRDIVILRIRKCGNNACMWT